MSEYFRKYIKKEHYPVHPSIIKFKTNFKNCVLDALKKRQWKEVENDEWSTSTGSLPLEQGCICRVHQKPRRTLFTPMKVPGSPPASELAPTRITTGIFTDNGEEFCYIDCWTRRDGQAHKDLERRWRGSTTFFRKTTSASKCVGVLARCELSSLLR